MFDADPQLAAETAADARARPPGSRDAGMSRISASVFCMSKGSWRIAPHRQRAVAVPARDRGARLGVTRMHERRREAMLVDAIGTARKPASTSPRRMRARLATLPLAVEHRQRLVVAPVRMDQRRALRRAPPPCRTLRAAARTRSSIAAQRRFGDLQRGRGNGRDRLPESARRSPAKTVGPSSPCRSGSAGMSAAVRIVRTPGMRQRRRDIEPHDPGMRHRCCAGSCRTACRATRNRRHRRACR